MMIPDIQYLFEVNKQTHRFNWHHSVGMDGKQFLLGGTTDDAPSPSQ